MNEYGASVFEKHRFLTSIVIPILFLIFYYVVSIAAQMVFIGSDPIVLTIGIDLFVLVAVAWYCIYAKTVPLSTFSKRVSVIILVGMFIFAFVCNIFGQCFSSIIVAIGDASFEAYSATASSVDILELALLSCVVAPIFEEVLFRWCLFGQMSRNVSPIIAAVFSSAVFALSHGTFAHLPMTFIIGMLCCWVYAKTASIIAPIILHVLINAASTFVPVVYLPEIFANPIFVIAGYVILMIIVMVFICKIPRFILSKNLGIKKLIGGSFVKLKPFVVEEDESNVTVIYRQPFEGPVNYAVTDFCIFRNED